jgi:hypothetical protein
MFERLLELLLHAKTGVIAGVFLIGTTGALVTATVQNGVTTITITQASASPSASVSPTATATASPTATATASPSASPSSSPSSSPSASASPNACSDQAHAAAAAVQTVNSAFSKFHTDLEHMRKDSDKDSGKATIENADRQLQQIRQDAVKAIHATNTCASKGDDEDKAENDQDEDKNDDNDSEEQGSTHNGLLAFLQGLFGSRLNTTTTSASPSPAPTSSATTNTTFTGTDPQAIADQAVAAMTVVFNDAVQQLAAPTASPQAKNTKPPFTARPSRTPRSEKSGHSDSESDSGRD